MQADSELAGAYGYVPWIAKAPNIQETLMVSQIVKDEVRHARVMYRLLEQLGVDVDSYFNRHEFDLRVSEDDIGTEPGVGDLLDGYDDEALQDLMTNLGGHCLETILEAFRSITDDKPACFIAYTIKGHGLPLAGHKDNHAGIMNTDQMEAFRRRLGVEEGEEWDPFAGLALPPAEIETFLASVPFKAENGGRRKKAAAVPVPDRLPRPDAATISTQEAFGRILYDLAGTDEPLAGRIVTTSPDEGVPPEPMT